jgi:hypothetical protein
MEQMNTTSTEALTEEQLRDAGASTAYISYYRTAKQMGESTASTVHAEKVVREGVTYPGGGFHEALWSDNTRRGGDNPFGADNRNSRILEQAGVYPYY